MEEHDDTVAVEAVPGMDGFWFELTDLEGARPPVSAALIGPVIFRLLDVEREVRQMADELAGRYEEIELLYTISEVLGRTIKLQEAAQTIVQEVGSVFGARRATILVYSEPQRLLQPVAGWGIEVGGFEPISVDDPQSIAAQAFREQRIISYDPTDPEAMNIATAEGRTYRGSAFLSVPIMYRAPHGPMLPVGVINLTDRIGTDAFTPGQSKLMAAIASQIGAAIQNAHLISRDLEQQRLRHEMELAHDLQLKLLPPTAMLGPAADVAARCQPAESVGGDFYHFLQLPDHQIGVMLGDVSSHGFSAALIMALVLSAAGIHAEAARSPEDALRRLLESISEELAKTEMYLSLFYGVADPDCDCLRYANAGHPHAFLMREDGAAERLTATSPPLGFVDEAEIESAEATWKTGSDMLVLFSDGIADARDADGEKFTEQRVLEILRQQHAGSAAEIVSAVFDAVTRFSAAAVDDRTLVVLKA